jgi:DeoR/GlpR family transcriptional regulator of sugar metabolism
VKAAERQIRIRELLEEREFVDLETFCRELRGSESTVRRDLVLLERQRVLKRVHGGALSVQPPRGHLLDFDWQRRRQSDEKRRIGARAAALIEDDQTVILDGGSTVAAVAEHLADRSLHAITNSLAIAQVLRDSRDIEVTLTGGYLFPRLEVLLGPLCEHMLASVAADVLVMGIGGATAAGFTNNNTLLVGSERKMIEVSRKVIIVADSSKFGRAAMVPLAPLDIADVVVSDSRLAPDHRQMLEAASIEVVLA